MKQFSRFLLLSVLLVSCANSVTPVPNVTVTSQATVTFTPTFTEIPETPTLTPVDPNAPEAYTKFENGKYYMDKNGETFMWTEIETSPTNHFFEWTRPATVDPKGVWIVDKKEFGVGYPSTTRMTVNLLPVDQLGANLWVDHPDPTGLFPTTYEMAESFSGRYYNDLRDKLKSKYPGSQFKDAFYGGTLDVEITTQDGVTHHWNPAGDYIVTQVPFDNATGPEFMEHHDEVDPSVIYRLALTTDDTGNLHAFIAVPDITKLNEKQRARFVLAGLWVAIKYADGTPMPILKDAMSFPPSVINGTNRGVPKSGYSHLVFEEK